MVAEAEIEIVGFTTGSTFIVILFELAVLLVTQVNEDVNVQVTTALSVKDDDE